MKKCSLLLFLVLCMGYGELFAAHFELESPVFKLNSLIPKQYTCDGVDQSPPLTWHDVPAKTQSLALVVTDANAPAEVSTHWVLFNIPPTVSKLDAGSPVPQGATSSKNSWGNTHYRGPCPAIGAHSYVFTLYALDKVLSVPEDASTEMVLEAMTGYVIASAKLLALYQR